MEGADTLFHYVSFSFSSNRNFYLSLLVDGLFLFLFENSTLSRVIIKITLDCILGKA